MGFGFQKSFWIGRRMSRSAPSAFPTGPRLLL
jgi:hypothetical protein